MKFWLIIFLILISFTSCNSAKISNTSVNHTSVKSKSSIKNSNRAITNKIIRKAQSFNGTKYRFGGTTKKGMDCSGLIFIAFKSESINLPRVSRDMASQGRYIKLNDVQKGDLLFFRTNKNKRIINHVGLVVKTEGKNIHFIHATTSKGVITSSLSERYWNNSFKEARRIL